MECQFLIKKYNFDDRLERELKEKEKDYLSWPIVYLLENRSVKEAYVGETTDMIARMKSHLSSQKRKILETVFLIQSDCFNKSATLDIEANLIRYLSADGTYTLQNGNLGLTNHFYFQKEEIYWRLFKGIWNELQKSGIARHSLEYIDNTDLFKYSPYKRLSLEQTEGLKQILESLLDPKVKVNLIHGGAGTGKSVLAIFLFKLLKTDLSDFNRADFDEQDEELFKLVLEVRKKYQNLEMGLVIPMQSFRKTISKVFRNIKGLSSNMVIGPAEVVKKSYDLLVVDEGHRLRRRRNLSSYYHKFDEVSEQLGLDKLTCTELDWVLLSSNKSVIFYDEFQSIRPSDVDWQAFYSLQSKSSTRVETLKSQFRVRGGEDYIAFIHKLFSEHSTPGKDLFRSIRYDLRLFEDLDKMVDVIKKKDRDHGLSRLIAGFAWEWVSKKDPSKYDIVIGDTRLRWNSTDVDWVNTENAINEVGCIHTTQGYDLNYAGVIIGPELDYDFDSNSFVVYKERYCDRNGKITINDEETLKRYILNIYRTLLFRGIQGTFIYACNENLRKYLSNYINVEGKKAIVRELRIFKEPASNRIPFYDLKISAGDFSGLQTPEHIQYLELDRSFKQTSGYFACKVVGESMNKIIPNGSICLFEKYEGGSRNARICLVESINIDDPELGGHYTIKEYTSKKAVSDDGWQHQEIVLSPRSTDDTYKPIILRDEQTLDCRVIGVFIQVLDGYP